MTFDRRTFLSGGVALGFGSWLWGRCGQGIAQSLAATNGQKLALLLGSGQGNGDRPPLLGCANDMEMLGEVLRSRYLFSPSDVVNVGHKGRHFI